MFSASKRNKVATTTAAAAEKNDFFCRLDSGGTITGLRLAVVVVAINFGAIFLRFVVLSQMMVGMPALLLIIATGLEREKA